MQPNDINVSDLLATDVNAAFDLVITNYTKPLRSFVYEHIGNVHVTDDIVQDIFMKAWVAFRGYSSERRRTLHLSSFLFTMAKNACANYWRSVHAQSSSQYALQRLYFDLVTENELSFQEIENGLVEEIEKGQKLAILHTSLQKIPSIYSQTIHLFYFEEMSCEAIAETFQKPLGTIKSYLSRGRNQLKALIMNEGEMYE